MPWYKLKIHFGISEELKTYIRTTYGGLDGELCPIFTISDRYTEAIVFAENPSVLNAIRNDIRTKTVDMIETVYNPD